MNDFIRDFQSHLADRDCAERTLRGYLSDLLQFADWFEQVNGEASARSVSLPATSNATKTFCSTSNVARPAQSTAAWPRFRPLQNGRSRPG